MQRENMPKKLIMKIALDKCAQTEKGTYDINSLKEILSGVPFTKMAIPLYSYKNIVLDKDKLGTIQIGYVNDYDATTQTFTVAINQSWTETIKGLGDDIVVYARCLVKDGVVSKVTGLDLCPVTYYK